MRLIPEWNNHTNCLIAWPCNQDLYGNRLHQARIEIANLANQISEEEEVYIYCNKIDYKKCSKMISNKNIYIFGIAMDAEEKKEVLDEANKIYDVIEVIPSIYLASELSRTKL